MTGRMGGGSMKSPLQVFQKVDIEPHVDALNQAARELASVAECHVSVLRW